jgi:hypothetical protein
MCDTKKMQLVYCLLLSAFQFLINKFFQVSSSPGGGCGAGVGGSGAGSCVTQKNAASILLAFVCFPVPD